MRQPLHEGDNLAVFFAIDEETDEAYIDLESSASGPDLSDEEDIVVVIGGSPASFEHLAADGARAALGNWFDIQEENLELAIRVGEWFESWELA